MAQVKRVDNSRKEHVCGKGNHVIPKGDSYLMASPGFRRRKPLIRCVDHPFRPSELTTSSRSAPLSALEAWSDAVQAGFDTHDDLESAWQELGDALEEYVDERQTALDAWEHGNSQLEEYLDTAQAALDEWESHTIESYDEEEPDADEHPKRWERWDEERLDHLSEQTEEAGGVASGIDV